MKKTIRKDMILKTGSLLMGAAVVIIMSESAAMAADYNETGQNFFVNGTQITNAKVYSIEGSTFVPAEDVAKFYGDSTEFIAGRLKIVQGDKTLIFIEGQSVYTVNGETKPISVKDVNGVRIPTTAKMKSINKKLYVPLEILRSELGYDISSDNNNIWIGEKPSTLPATNNQQQSIDNSNTITQSKSGNMYLSIDNGWVCPQLKSTSTDDLLEDSKALQRELEFVQNGQTPTSANYDPINGAASFVTTSVGPINSDEFTSIYFAGYKTQAKEPYMQKINKINPQVLKFYFPTSWEWIHNNYMNGNSLNGQRFKIDGRDTYFTAGSSSTTIHISKINGGLTISGMPSISKTIGTPQNIQRGTWEQTQDGWKFKKNTGDYATNWLSDGGYWYYLNSNGVMKTGWIYDGGNWYYCWSNGQMATNTTIDGYYVDANGVMR